MALKLRRRQGQSIVLYLNETDTATVKVDYIDREGTVGLSLVAPPGVKILRDELLRERKGKVDESLHTT